MKLILFVDHSSADREKLETGNERTTKKVFDLDTVPKCVGEQNLSPQSAWVCCDACLKWRRIPATLADLINETNGKWYASIIIPVLHCNFAIKVEQC